VITERLELVPLRVEHADEMAVVLSDPALRTYIGGRPDSLDGLRTGYERMVAGSSNPDETWLNWVIRLRDDGRLIGTVQATITGPVAEIAWVVGTPWQGRGYATEAARGLVGWLSGERIDDIVAHIHPEHQASETVATRAGLVRTDERQDDEVRWRLSR
jgi:RimJ/RimL family protein N-acetyltransferase